jgi:hypothetical protein
MLRRKIPKFSAAWRWGKGRSKLNTLLCGFRALQATQHELERQQAIDSLKKGLDRRPEKEELVERTPDAELLTMPFNCTDDDLFGQAISSRTLQPHLRYRDSSASWLSICALIALSTSSSNDRSRKNF